MKKIGSYWSYFFPFRVERFAFVSQDPILEGQNQQGKQQDATKTVPICKI